MIYSVLDNQIATLTAVNPATGDQITAYLYGTTLTNSGVACDDLLSAVYYPDAEEAWPNLSAEGWASLTVDDWANLEITSTDSVSYTYNALGQQASITDQRGTVRSLYYDKLGRLTNGCVSTVGRDTDATVLQIAATYEVRGMVQSVTSLDNATPGGGTVLNQCALTYNGFGQLTEEHQEHSGTVTTSTVSVQYAYATATPNNIRAVNLTYPNGRIIGYSFGAAGGMNDYLSRIQAIQSDGADIAQYDYLALGTVVRITYPEPGVWLDLWGGTSGTFNGLDQFNRIIDQRWQNAITTTPTDIDRYQYGYDQNSIRLWKANVVGTAAVGNLDEGYTYDTLNRLTQMQRGTLSGGVIIGTPTVEQDWTLDPLGNWSTFATAASGTSALNQQRTANTVNEITAITETTGPNWITPTYDPAGNTMTMPQVADPTQSFTAAYDAWNRMVLISDSSGTVGTYAYDGRNRRITKTTSSETRHFYWTVTWQDIEERAGAATTMDTQYLWGIRYIDELICRDDATPQRLYGCQDANFNVTSIGNTGGIVTERYSFVPYGTRTPYDSHWIPQAETLYSWVVGYLGLVHDSENGLVYSRYRYLHLQVSRWLQRDPGGRYSNGCNLYEFLLSRPTHFVDPLGTDVEQLVQELPPPVQELTGPVVVAAGVGYGIGQAVNNYTPVDEWLGEGIYWVFYPPPVPVPPAPRPMPRPQPPQPQPVPVPTPVLPKPKPRKPGPNDSCPCKWRWIPRAGGNVWHDALADLLSDRKGQDLLVTTPRGIPARYDGWRIGLAFELKTGHRWLNLGGGHWFTRTYRAMVKYGELELQFGREQLVADACGFDFRVYTDNDEAARSINFHFVPVPLHLSARNALRVVGQILGG
jgi:RHS repeat-associated protein